MLRLSFIGTRNCAALYASNAAALIASCQRGLQLTNDAVANGHRMMTDRRETGSWVAALIAMNITMMTRQTANTHSCQKRRNIGVQVRAKNTAAAATARRCMPAFAPRIATST